MKWIKFSAVLLVLIAAYLLAWPVPIDPVSWRPGIVPDKVIQVQSPVLPNWIPTQPPPCGRVVES